MKYTETISRAIMVYWIVVLVFAAYFAVGSFYDFFRGVEAFNYRIILRLATLIVIFYALASLIIGLFKEVQNSISLIKKITKFSYLLGILGLTALIMHISNIVKSSDAYLFGGICGFVALSGYLSNYWFNRNYKSLIESPGNSAN